MPAATTSSVNCKMISNNPSIALMPHSHLTALIIEDTFLQSDYTTQTIKHLQIR